MIKVASTGVMDHTEIQTNRFKPNPNASIHNAAATASTSTITVKMQAF
jgi:allantoicase